ncbi:Fc.00g028380.m01.CDS01 [Cosmosporella sp. VM-42]
MKAALFLSAACATLAYPAAAKGPETICGDLGVMKVENMPEDVSVSDLRMCTDHPLGRNRTISLDRLSPYPRISTKSLSLQTQSPLLARELAPQLGCTVAQVAIAGRHAAI